MSKRALDRDRFAKCRALMDRGATAGEQAAGEAAAARVAAAAGLSLAEAISLVDAADRRFHSDAASQDERARRPQARPTYAWAEPKQKPHPITVEELLRQKEADAAQKKAAAARQAKRAPKGDKDFDRWAEEAREAQAMRDREWAERRKQREEAQP
ncbi:hypothetical protein [Methylobacterium flocculans]|uniref:hypothetical protein n=1 Tax=Methylobacterium flocculans TaxID=2984843 RepID=UPI0021F2FC5A|nr:hypothetical protein [Methylobacterium sp. FF17]